jgi:hypothetical protein
VVKSTPGSIIFGSFETWERKVLLCCVLMNACLFMNAYVWHRVSRYLISYGQKNFTRIIIFHTRFLERSHTMILLDLHVRSLLCYLRVLGLMGLFALPHWTSYIMMCFYFLKRRKFSTKLHHPKCTHIYISYVHVNVG